MKHVRLGIILAALLVLAAVNQAIFAKEQVRQKGTPVLLELAPLDPRSLMQGDYMALRFALATQIEAQLGKGADWPLEGSQQQIAIALDPQGVAVLAAADSAGTLRLRYRIRKHRVWLGTNAFFFEEGSAERYNGARYGDFRLDPATGEALLVGLRGADLRPL